VTAHRTSRAFVPPREVVEPVLELVRSGEPVGALLLLACPQPPSDVLRPSERSTPVAGGAEGSGQTHLAYTMDVAVEGGGAA